MAWFPIGGNMSTIELDTHINNLLYTLNQLRAGRDAIRYGHAMSSDDVQQFSAARNIVRQVLGDKFDTLNDDMLVTGMETHIAHLMGTQYAK